MLNIHLITSILIYFFCFSVVEYRENPADSMKRTPCSSRRHHSSRQNTSAPTTSSGANHNQNYGANSSLIELRSNGSSVSGSLRSTASGSGSGSLRSTASGSLRSNGSSTHGLEQHQRHHVTFSPEKSSISSQGRPFNLCSSYF